MTFDPLTDVDGPPDTDAVLKAGSSSILASLCINWQVLARTGKKQHPHSNSLLPCLSLRQSVPLCLSNLELCCVNVCVYACVWEREWVREPPNQSDDNTVLVLSPPQSPSILGSLVSGERTSSITLPKDWFDWIFTYFLPVFIHTVKAKLVLSSYDFKRQCSYNK